jgi:ABC-type nitrate/sulfonate/bicarbonate transport system substrate-binding protein
MLEPHSEEILAYMQAEGINSQEMILYPHTFDPQPLIDGNVDAMSAYITDEPFLLDNAGLSYRFYSPRSGGIDFYGDTLFTSEEVINQHPEMVAAFLRASLRGWVYAFQNEDAAIDLILSKYSSRHSREHLKYEADQMRNLVLPDVVEIGYISPARWERIGETYVDLGILEQKPDLSGFIYDPSMKQGINWIYMFAGALFTIVAMLLMLGVASGLKIIVTQWRKTKISGRKP